MGAESRLSLVSGEEKAGLLVCVSEPARQVIERYDESCYSMALRKHIEYGLLREDVTVTQLTVLVVTGRRPLLSFSES